MDEKEIKEKIAEYLGIDEIKYYILDGSTIVLVYNAKGSYDGNIPIK